MTLKVFFVAVMVIAFAITFLIFWKGLARLRKFMSEVQLGARAASENQSMLIVATQQFGHARPPLIEDGPSVFSAGGWERLGGSGKGWPTDKYYKVRGLAVVGEHLYASLTGPRQDGPLGEVWCHSNNEWTSVADANIGPWRGPSSVDHLFADDGYLFAAERRGVWRLKNEHWTALSDGLELDEICGPYCFAHWRGAVVMGQWGKPRVAILSKDGHWSYLPNPNEGWGVNTRTIYCLLPWRGHLYAATGTGKMSGPGATVWRYDGVQWEKVAGGGLRGSWVQTGIPFVLSLIAFQDRIVATLSRPESTPLGASNIWVFDGERWGALAVGASPKLMTDSLIMNDAAVYKGRLVVATGHSTRSPAELWELGPGVAWNAVGPPELVEPGIGDGGWWVYRMHVDGPHLYATTAGHRGAAGVFRFTS